jgi:hypothetical protein
VAVRGKPTRYGKPDAGGAPGHDRGSRRSIAHATQYLAPDRFDGGLRSTSFTADPVRRASGG